MILKVNWMILPSHLDQARQQNEEWIRKQTRAEAKKEKVSEALASFTKSINRPVSD